MSIIKVTLFQKNIKQDINRDQKVKLISQKSDFLVFPEYFPLTGRWTEKNPIENSKIYIDRLLQVSEYYKGVIIGGSVFREFNGEIYNSCPIIKDLSLIDWYDKKKVKDNSGSLKLSPGKSEGIFILSGVRFGVCLGDDIRDESILQSFQDEKVEIIFNPCSIGMVSNEEESYAEDLKTFPELSGKFSLNLVRVCSLGDIFSSRLTGRSLYSSASGIKWKVAPFENQTEIIKTLSITLSGKIS